MKVIDLLNKIANGEITENTKFRRVGILHSISGKDVDYFTYIKDGIYKITFKDGSIWNYDYKIPFECRLNDEIEIIEEPKKIEKVILLPDRDNNGHSYRVEVAHDNIKSLANKINELIDKINEGVSNV